MSEKPIHWRNGKLGTEGGLRARRPIPFNGVRPYLATSDVQGFDIRPSEYVEFYARPARAGLELAAGDVLQAKMKDTNKPVYVDVGKHGWLASTGFAQFTPSISGNNQKYFFHYLSSDGFLRKKDALCVGSTQQAISESDLTRIDLKLPLVAEQERIAEVLDSVYLSIEKTESLIAKYQQIKAGLMHDLFTRGVTADGKLRPPREQAPELYQETPIGWIPKKWVVETLEKLLAPVANNLRSGPFGSALVKSELVEEGIPFLGIDNIFRERFDRTYRRFVSRKKYVELNRCAVRPKDVVITIMGTVGRCCVLPEDIGDALSSKHLWTMTLDQRRAIPELVCWQLNYAAWVLAWFRRESQGAVMDAIQSSTLRTLRLPVPPMDEQEAILQKYLVSTRKINTEYENLRKLKDEKKGLTHDLLTGKVRVTA